MRDKTYIATFIIFIFHRLTANRMHLQLWQRISIFYTQSQGFPMNNYFTIAT